MSYSTKSKEELITLRQKIPLANGFIPIILRAGTKDTPILNKELFICSFEKNSIIILQHLRNKIKIDPGQGLYLFIGNLIISPNHRISDLYNKYNNNGFLIIDYTLENCFGE